MLTSITVSDVFVALVLMLPVPFLVKRYLSPSWFSPDYRLLVTVGGIGWLFFAFFHEEFAATVLGVNQMDAIGHMRHGQVLADYILNGQWDQFWENVGLGNKAYHAYSGLMFAVTGVSPIGIVAINAFFAFWGGLILAGHFTSRVPAGKKNLKCWMILIFFPSVVFWTTANLKEGFMYWSICAFYTAMMTGGRRSTSGKRVQAIAAVAVGTLFRPHVILAWGAACLTVSLFSQKRKAYAFLLLLALPLVFKGLQSVTPVEATPESLLEKMQHQQEALAKSKGGSTIEYDEGGPIFFVSGFTAVFFRPFPWRLHSGRYFITALETWGLTLCLVFVWLRMTRWDKRNVLASPEIRVAIIACLGFSVAFTYMPNEGLLARQRVQVLPALLTLLYLPIVWRSFVRELVTRQRRVLRAMARGQPPALSEPGYTGLHR